MFDAIAEGALAAMGLTKEQMHKMVTEAFAKVHEIDARLARIERALNIRNVQPAETIDLQAEENGNDDERASA